MVRILFLLLIFINLIYFAWNLYSPPQVVEQQPAALAKDIKRLTLLSERKLEPRTLAKDSHDKTDSQLTESPVIQSEREEVASKDDVESADVREGITDKATVIEEYGAASSSDTDPLITIDEGKVIETTAGAITAGDDTELVTAMDDSPQVEPGGVAITEQEGHEVSPEDGLGVEITTENKAIAKSAGKDKVGDEMVKDTLVFPDPATEGGADEEISVESTAGLGEEDVAAAETENEAEINTDRTSLLVTKKNADSSRADDDDSSQSNLDSDVSVVQEQIAEVSKPAVEIRRCYTLGPFEEIMAAENLLIQIQNTGFEASRRAITEQQPARYWVYLPSVESQSAASKIAKELASKGIKDYYVITENENKNAISLGLFSKHTGARRRYKKIQALGYQPQMEVRFRDKTIYWLDYDEVDDQNLPPQIWVSLMTEGGAVQRIVRKCDIRP